MNDIIKSATYGVVAIVLSGLAYWVNLPRDSEVKEDDLIGKPLLTEFTKSDQAAKIRIASYDAKNLNVEEMIVQKKTGRWVVPSMRDYPADNLDRVAKAASALVGMEIVAMVSRDSKEHDSYGVLDPTNDRERDGKKGIGKLVEIYDTKENPLAQLIIGKPVKTVNESGSGDDDDKSPKRFVRKAGQDEVFVVKLESDSYTVDKRDWFNVKLTKLKGFDLAKIDLTHEGARDDQGNSVPISTTSLKFENNKWTFDNATETVNGKPMPIKLTDNEEVNTQKVTGLKSLIENLEIQAIVPATGRKIMPEYGQVAYSEPDGVRVNIRYGEELQLADETKMRVVMLKASVDNSLLPEPKYEPVPEVTKPGAAKKPEDEKAEGKKPEGKGDGEKKDDKQPKAKKVTEEDRKKVEKANADKKADWERKKTEAGARVDDLNYRYDGWVFLISQKDFDRLQVTRYELVKEKKSADGVDVFRKFQEDGLKLEEKKEDGPGPGGPPAGLPPGLIPK